MSEQTIDVTPRGTFVGVVKRDEKYQWFDKFKSRFITLKNADASVIDELMRKSNKHGDVFELPVSNITKSIMKHFGYVQRSIDYPVQELPIDPYIFGLWLGDGTSRTSALTTIDKLIGEIWEKYAESVGLSVRWSGKPRKTEKNEGEYDETVTLFIHRDGDYRNTFLTSLQNLGVLHNKHIPDIYLHNSKENRLKLLAGLIDTDGGLESATYNISQKSTALSDGIVKLAQGLGFYTVSRKTIKKCTNSPNPDHMGEYNKVSIFITRHTPCIPVRLSRKQNPSIGTCPQFDEKGVPKTRVYGQKWKFEDLQTLYNAVETFKTLEPEQKTIPWTMLNKIAPTLSRFGNDAMRTAYAVLKGTKKVPKSNILYSPENLSEIKKKCELINVEDRTCLIEQEWMKKYNEALETYKNAYTGDMSGNVGKWANWFYINKKISTLYRIKKELLADIQKIVDDKPLPSELT